MLGQFPLALVVPPMMPMVAPPSLIGCNHQIPWERLCHRPIPLTAVFQVEATGKPTPEAKEQEPHHADPQHSAEADQRPLQVMK